MLQEMNAALYSLCNIMLFILYIFPLITYFIRTLIRLIKIKINYITNSITFFFINFTEYDCNYGKLILSRYDVIILL